MSGLEYVVMTIEGVAEEPARRARGLRPARGSRDRGFGPDNLLGGVLESTGDRLVSRDGETAISIETATLGEREVADVQRDPKKRAILNMPITLVEPVSAAEAGIETASDPVERAKTDGISWGVRAVGADKSSLTGSGVKVAVLDTGIEPSHPAFAGINFNQSNRKNFTSDGEDDRQGHGTHCAGTIFGRDVEGVRIGIARGVTDVLIGKVLDDRGRGSTNGVIEGLKWAHSNGANVVSMSLGFDFPALQEKLMASRPPRLATSMALRAYRENLRLFETIFDLLLQESDSRAGMVLVAASGNESERVQDPDFVIDVSIPAAAARDMISVGAISQTANGFGIASFSNINPRICAPGVAIVSAALGGGLKALNGTSMACPHVAGVAALYWEQAQKDEIANGTNVRGSLLATASRDGFLPDVETRDRGVGKVVAPMG